MSTRYRRGPNVSRPEPTSRNSRADFARRFLTATQFGCIVLTILGCGPSNYYPVRGRIFDTEGGAIAELAGAQIEFECREQGVSAVGEIRADGTFSLLTERPGDGVLPGRYQILIARRYLDPETPTPRVVDQKYELFETSGLEATVEPKANTFEFRLERHRAEKAAEK